VRLNSGGMALHIGDRYRLRLHSVLCDDPWRISPYTRTLSNQLVSKSGNLVQSVQFMHERTDARVRVGLVSDPLADIRARIDSLRENCLAVALSEVTGRPPSSHRGRGYGEVPLAVKRAASLVLMAVPQVLELRDRGLVRPLTDLGMDLDSLWTEFMDVMIVGPEDREWRPHGKGRRNVFTDPEFALKVEQVLDSTDWASLNHGAAHLALAVQTAAARLQAAADSLADSVFEYSAETPLGRVMLRGSGDHRYEPGGYLLIIDVSGDDTYRAGGGTSSAGVPVSILMDAAGNDTYVQEDEEGDASRTAGAATVPAFGAGVFGYGFCLDLAGSDRYYTQFAGTGFGMLGTGVLWDWAGDDTYDGVAHVQGSGSFGAGALIDIEGSDTYHAYRYCQGFGFTKGCGLLLDVGGDDVYDADDEDFIYSSDIYSKVHNLNMAQGFGYGRRADYSDGHSWAGGIGYLVDAQGNDRYSCGIYGQGSGYWYGTGFLVDKEGDDAYRSVQYATGAGPHFAIGVLQDDAGDDRYLVQRRQCLGHARDYSIGWFEEGGGNDYYNAPGSTLGDGNICSLGFFWEKGGDDVYVHQGGGLGSVHPEHKGRLADFDICLGLFVDEGGKDRYLIFPFGPRGSREGYIFMGEPDTLEVDPVAGNNKAWLREHRRLQLTSFGIGLDAD
jgi:hypothetical protein